MVYMQYDAGSLAQGAAGHRSVSELAELVGTTLSQLAAPTGGFGTVPTAPAFAAALEECRLVQAQTAVREAEDRRALAERVSRTAALGGDLTASTTQTAQGIAGVLAPLLGAGTEPGSGSGQPAGSSIAQQMGGPVGAAPVAGPRFTPGSILEGMS